MPTRILIAEDDPGSRDLITAYASTHGFDFVVVTDGIDLLTAYANGRFDVIITDLKMANLNGASAIELMKMQGNITPVIALTALSQHETRLIRDKFVRIFYKPCNYKELFEYIESLIVIN